MGGSRGRANGGGIYRGIQRSLRRGAGRGSRPHGRRGRTRECRKRKKRATAAKPPSRQKRWGGGERKALWVSSYSIRRFIQREGFRRGVAAREWVSAEPMR